LNEIMNDHRDQGVPAVASRRSLEISWPVQFTAIASLAIYLHSLMWWTEPRDMALFQRPWFQHLVHYGPIGAFAHPFSNYTPAYLYLLAVASMFHGSMEPMFLVKSLSVAGTIFASLAVADLVRATGGRPRYAALLLILPSAAINAALLAQCDALWAGACTFAVAAAIDGRTRRSLVWCGFAIAFKAQAIFIAPFIVGVLIGRRVPLWYWTIPALVFAALMLPAWLAGWPAWDLAMVYPNQPGWVPFPGRLANPWMFGTVFAPAAAKDFYWAGFAAAAMASICIAGLTSTSVRNPRAMLLVALLSAIAVPYLLPKMLERYYFLGDLLSLALAISYRSRATVLIAAAVQSSSFLSLLTYMYFYYRPFPTLVGAIVASLALVAIYVLARRSGARWPVGRQAQVNGSGKRTEPSPQARSQIGPVRA
jgi:Gpi18-like mannosyltransferase